MDTVLLQEERTRKDHLLFRAHIRGGCDTPPPIFGRKLQKVGPKFIKILEKSVPYKPVWRCVMSSIPHSF